VASLSPSLFSTRLGVVLFYGRAGRGFCPPPPFPFGGGTVQRLSPFFFFLIWPGAKVEGAGAWRLLRLNLLVNSHGANSFSVPPFVVGPKCRVFFVAAGCSFFFPWDRRAIFFLLDYAWGWRSGF